MPNVATYWPSKYYPSINAALAWLLGRQGSPSANWQANALFAPGAGQALDAVAGSSGLVECGIASLTNFLTGLTASGAQNAPFALSPIESITLSMPAGYYGDNLLSPDGYPINASGQPVPWGSLVCNSYLSTSAMQGMVRAALFDATSSITSPGLPATTGVIAKWVKNTRYPQFSMIVDTHDNVQMAMFGGITANASNPPSWPSGSGMVGALTGDGTQIWKGMIQSYSTIGPVATGYAWNLLNDYSTYRVDFFSNQSGTWHYVGSSALLSAVPVGKGPYAGAWVFSVASIGYGNLLAVLYPTSVAAPSPGWTGSAIPTGWISHSNTGVAAFPNSNLVGGKLTAYKAQIYSYSGGTETLVEDNIPIICGPDGFHARVGGSVWVTSGVPTVHLLYNDPVAGWTEVYSSLESSRAYESLPRSYDVPTSDPAYIQSPVAGSPAPQNRSRIEDCALAIMTYSAAGNYDAADAIIQELNSVLQITGAALDQLLEDGTGLTGGIMTNWSTISGTQVTAPAKSMTPQLPPTGRGSVQLLEPTGWTQFVGPGLPSSDNFFSIEFLPSVGSLIGLNFIITVKNSGSTTWTITVSQYAGPPKPAYLLAKGPTIISFSAVGTAITVLANFLPNQWQSLVLDLAATLAACGGGTFSTITGIQIQTPVFLWFTNMILGKNGQALSTSYDAYGGEPDQQPISSGANAWVAYAYAVYMQVSQDYSAWPQLQSLLEGILLYQSTAADSTVGLFYQGNGYYDTGGTYHPGPVLTCLMRDQIIIWFTLLRCAVTLQTIVVQLQKGSQISVAQANSLAGTLATCQTAAATIAANAVSVLYIAPAGGVPGHFAQGVTGSTVDTSQALEGGASWAAIWADAIGRDDLAEQCIEFAFDKLYLTGQTLALSAVTNTYNEVYQLKVGVGISARAVPFNGLKPFNDSAGGYSGSPVTVVQEGTWSFILALLRLYNDLTVQSFFTGLGTTIDAVLQGLIGGQASIQGVTGNGSLLMATTASRALPYSLFVWPAVAPTAWFWLAATNPFLLLTVNGQPSFLPYVYVPAGAEQSIDDKNGSSSVGQMEIHSIDPGGLLHTLAAQQSLIGQVARFSMGFPGIGVGDFTPLHVMTISELAFDADGRVIIKLQDLKRWVVGSYLWANGGPEEFLPGQKNTNIPVGASWQANSYPVSNDNPRFIAGNPLDLFLAAMQNELGVGQDPALDNLIETSGSGELFAAVNPFWQKFLPSEGTPSLGDDTTLIDPNQYLDIAGIQALRDGQFSGDWLEFKITSPQQGRSWLEEQILKPLGLVMVVTSSGAITLKPMKNPVDQTPVAGFTADMIMGIPEVSLAPIINAISFRLDVDDSTTNTSARTYNSTVALLQQASFNLFNYLYNHQVESTGLKMARGGTLRAELLGDQLFNRYAFAAPVYQVTVQLLAMCPELKDWVSLTHPLVPDYLGGGRGVQNIPCEVIGRAPNYTEGQIKFTLLDMRRAVTAPARTIALSTLSLPSFGSATAAEQEEYAWVSPSNNGAPSQVLTEIF